MRGVKKMIKLKSELESALYYGPYGMCVIIIFLTEHNLTLFARYTTSHTLDPYVVLPTTNGEAKGFGYWVKPAGIGCAGFMPSMQLPF